MRFFLSAFILIVLVLPDCYAIVENPDTTKSIYEKGLDKIKLQKARHFFLSRNYEAALGIYNDLHASNEDNPMINYRIGECYYEMSNFDEAVTYLDKAKSTVSEGELKRLHLVSGKTLHRLDELEKAIFHYEEYLKYLESKPNIPLSSKKEEIKEVEKYLESAKLAMELKNNPLDVKVRNIGDNVNSIYDDYGPSISLDGKTLIFTSRRPDTKGGLKDPADHKFYEDIYISIWDEENNKWSKAEGIQGRLNSEFHDAALSIAPDGQHIYVYKNFGENGSGEIFVSRLSSSGKWGSPRPVSELINSSYWESSASISGYGHKLYYVSERKDGYGMGDIYMAEKKRRDWKEPVNIGNTLNTIHDEKMVAIHPSGNILFFASDGHETMGGFDIFKSTFKNGGWTKPENVGYPINTVNDDVNFVLSADGKKAYYSGYKRTGFGEKDIYEIDLTKHNILELPVDSGEVVLEGTVFSKKNNKPVPVAILQFSISDTIQTEVVTNNEGKYKCVLKMNTEYDVLVEADDYDELEIKYTAPAANKEEKDWVIEPDRY